MSLFQNFDTQGMEQSQDRLGGYQIYESDIYSGTIKALYGGKAESGALSVTLVLAMDGGQEYSETIYVSDKTGKPHYTKDGKKMPLPGFTLVNELCVVACEKELGSMLEEEKILNIWDKDAKKQLPKAVRMLTEALGKRVSLGILRVKENKSEKDANNVYQPTLEVREKNAIDKVFHPTLKITVNEAREKKLEGGFWDGWLKKNKGQIRDRRELKDDGVPPSGGAPKAGPPAATGAAPRTSLFGKKS